ncbi:MAG: flagellar basal body rod protein FlgB [Buchnera aphidicola (Chaetogeoica yunlongensis)]
MLDKINHDLNKTKLSLNLHSYRQSLLASNISNAKTPKYQASDINFSKIFNKILDIAHEVAKKTLSTTSNKHIKNKNNSKNFEQNKLLNNNYVSKNGAVNVDIEKIKFVHNGLKYHADVVFINNKLRNITNVLQG